MASHSEGLPYSISFAETHSRRILQPYSDPAGGACNTLPQKCLDKAASASVPHDVTHAFQPQYFDLSRTHQPHSSLQSDAAPVFSEFDTQSTSTREVATSPLQSRDQPQTPRDVNVSRTDYLRALTSIVMNHSAAKMSAQLPKKKPVSPIKRAVFNCHTARTFVPRYIQRRTLSFQGPRSMRTSPQAVSSDWCARMKNMNRNQGEVTDPVTQNGSSSSENSKPTELSLTSSKDLKKTPPVLVQCSGEIVTGNCELMKERPQLPSSEVPEISGMIYTKCEEDFPNTPPETLPILVQCNGETIEQHCVQVQTLPSSVNVNEKAESSKSAASEEKARSAKRKKSRKTVISKIGFSKSFFLSKKRVRRPESRRIKSTLRSTDQPSISSGSTPSGRIQESQSSKATSSWRDQTGDLDKKSSAKRRVTFSEERGKEVRHRRLKKKRRSKSVSGNALTSKSSKPQKAENATQVEATLNHLRYTGKKVKPCLLQDEKTASSKTTPEDLPSGLSQDEHMVSLNSSHPLQTTCVNRCSLIQGQMHSYSNVGTASDPRYNLPIKREKDMHSSQIKTSKHTDGCNQTTKANFVNKSRSRDYRSATNSIETSNDIKRLAEATRCFLKHRKHFDVSEKAQNVASQGYPYISETEVNAPPALPPEENTIPVLTPAAPYKVGQRCDEILANMRQQSQGNNTPTQTSKACETPGPLDTIPMTESTGKKFATRSRYSSSPKRRRDFKYASTSKSTKTTTHGSDKRRGNVANHHDKKLSSLEVVEQWLHSSAASSQQGEPPEPLLSVEEVTTDSQIRPATRDMAVMATPRMMRHATHRNRRVNSKKQKPSSSNLSPKKTKSKKANVNTDNLDPNALRHKSIDAHARCLELLENSSYSLTSEMADQLKPKHERKQSHRSKRKTQMHSSDAVLHRVLQENTSSSFTPEKGSLVYKVHGQMVGTAQQSTPNVKLRGNATTNSKRMRFASTDPKTTRGKANKVPVKGLERDAKVIQIQGTCKDVERNGDSDMDCLVNMQTNAVERTRLPDISPAFTNPGGSAISNGNPQSNYNMNEGVVKQTNTDQEAITEERVNDKFHDHGSKAGRHGLSFWPKRRVSVCCKRLGGMSRRFRAPQWTDSSRKGTPTSHREQYIASSGVHGSRHMDNDHTPNVIENKEIGRVNTESERTHHVSGSEKERMKTTMEKLSHITHWNSSQRLGSHSSVSSRKTEVSSYSDVSGSTFSDTGKSNNCIRTRGLRSSVLGPNTKKSRGQEAVSTRSQPHDLPHLVVQCMGGTITPHPCASPSPVTKTAEGKDKGNQEENLPTKESSHMVLSITWGGTSCSLQCKKGPSSETSQVITLPVNVANSKDCSGNTTTEAPANLGQHVPGESEAKRRQKGLVTSPRKNQAKRVDASKCKVKAGRPTSRTGTPKMKQQASVPNASWGTTRRGNPQPNLAGNPKACAQSKKDKTVVEVKCSDGSPHVPSRTMRQRSKPTLPGPGVMKTPSSPCSKVSSPPRKNVPHSRSVGPSRGQTTHKSGERPGKDRKSSLSETVNTSVQVSRQDSAATTSSRKGSSHKGDDKCGRKTSASRQKSAGTSPLDSSKLVEAYVQTSEETPLSCLQRIPGVQSYFQKHFLAQNAVSVQTSGVTIPEKADVSFQTSVSTMQLPKPPSNLTSADFFTQTQRYLSNVACVLASQKKKALSRSEETPKTSDLPAEVEIILPERKRRETTTFREKSQESSSSSRATSTADASIHTPKSSSKRTPSSVLIQRTLRDAAHLLQRHRSLSAPQAPVTDKHHALMMEECGMRGPPPWPVRSGPVRECDTPSATVTSESTSTTSSLVPTSDSRSIPRKLSGKEKNLNESGGLRATFPLFYSEKFRRSPSLSLRRSPNASESITGASENVYKYHRRGGSSSGLVNRSDKVVPQRRKGDLSNATLPKGHSVNPNRTPITSPTKAYFNKKHATSDPIKPPLPPPRKLSTSPTLVPSRSFNMSAHSSKASNPTSRRLYQILQARNPNHPKPIVMRRSKKMGNKPPIRKARKGSVKPRQCIAVMDSAAAAALAAAATAAVRAVVDSENSTLRSASKVGGIPDPGNKESEPSKAPKPPEEKATVLPPDPASVNYAQRSRSTGATAPRVRQGPGSLLVVMPRVTDSPL